MWRRIDISRESFTRALRIYRGSISATSQRLGISEGATRKRLDAYGLRPEADRLRALHGVTGGRRTMKQLAGPLAVPPRLERRLRAERTRLLAAVERGRGQLSAAARTLRQSPAIVARRIALLGLSSEVDRIRDRYGLAPRWAGALHPTTARLGMVDEEAKERIIAALRTHGGNLSAAARALGVSPPALAGRVQRYGLRAAADDLRARHHQSGRRTTLPAGRLPGEHQQVAAALRANQGNVYRTAKALGFSESWFGRLLDRLELRPLADRLRARHGGKGPRRSLPDGGIDRHAIVRALEQARWDTRAAAERLGMRRGTLVVHIRKLRLRRPGYAHLPPAERQAALETALRAVAWRIDRAAERLGVHRSTCERDIRRFRLRRPPEHAPFSDTPKRMIVEALKDFGWNTNDTATHFGVSPTHLLLCVRQKGIQRPPKKPNLDPEQYRRLVDALRMGNGVVQRAARTLGVSCPTIDNWCAKFDVNPRDYRSG